MDIKEKYQSMSDSQKMLTKMVGILVGIILVFFIIILFMKAGRSKSNNYTQIETILSTAAQKYINANPDVMGDKIFGTTEINYEILVQENYMKDLERYLGKENNCSGASVIVYKNLDYYKYIPRLDCSDYEVKTLYSEITKEDNIITSGSGLYRQDNIYVYRGEYVDNYVSFNGETWRILSIDSEGNIKIQQENLKSKTSWDDRYNNELRRSSGINLYQGIEASRFKNAIMNAYNSMPDSAKSLIVPQQYCVGKRSETDEDKTGASECTERTELIGATAMNVYEFLNASLDPDCKNLKSRACSNYNYLARYNKNYWSITAQAENTNKVYYFEGGVYDTEASKSHPFRLVVTINGSINYAGGNGTSADPYLVK